MASHPRCWSGPAPSLARSAHGVERLVRGAGWGGGSAQAETRPPAVKAPESSEPPFSLPTLRGTQDPWPASGAPDGEPQGVRRNMSPSARPSAGEQGHPGVVGGSRPRKATRPRGHAHALQLQQVSGRAGWRPRPAQLTIRCAARTRPAAGCAGTAGSGTRALVFGSSFPLRPPGFLSWLPHGAVLQAR